MKKNLLLFIGNILLLLIFFVIIRGIGSIGSATNIIWIIYKRLMPVILIVLALLYLGKRSLNIPNDKYHKRFFRFQLVLYLLVWILIVYLAIDSYTVKKEPEQLSYALDEQRWDETYISSHFILNSVLRAKEQIAMVKYTGVDTADFAERCQVGLDAFLVLIDSIGEGQKVNDTSVLKLYGCYIDDSVSDSGLVRNIHMHFAYKGAVNPSGASFLYTGGKYVVTEIKINN